MTAKPNAISLPIELDNVVTFSSRDAWLSWRRYHVCASDIPAIMGESPFKKDEDVLREKILGDKQAITPAMQLGIDSEEAALDAAARLLGTNLSKRQVCVVCRENALFAATIDGISEDLEYVVETKCSKGISTKWVNNECQVPMKYYGQLQWQIYCLGVTRFHTTRVMYCEFDPENNSVALVEVRPDIDYIKRAVAAAEAFAKNFQGELFEKNTVELAPLELDDDTAFATVCSKYKELKARIDELEKEATPLKAAIIKRSGGKNCSCAGVSVKWTSVKGSLDYYSLPQLAGVDLAPFMKKGTVRCTVKA